MYYLIEFNPQKCI